MTDIVRMVLQAKFDTYRHLGIQEAFALPPASTPLAVGELAVQAMRAVAQAPGGTAWGKLAAIGAAGVAAAGYGVYRLWADSPRPLRVGDFSQPQPDPKVVAEFDLEFLKLQKTLAELSGDTSLAQLLTVRIQQLTPIVPDAQTPVTRTLTGGLNMVASTGDGGQAAAPQRAHNDEWEEVERRFEDPDPEKRLGALWAAHDLMPRLPDEADRESLRHLMLKGLKDTDTGVVYRAWYFLERHSLIDPATVTREMFTWSEPPGVPQLGVARAVLFARQPESSLWGWDSLVSEIHADANYQSAVVPLYTIRALHSPTYYDPAAEIDANAMKKQLADDIETLAQFIRQAGPHPIPEQVLSQFFHSYSQMDWPITAYQCPSGWRILIDGHHRIAVLLEAVRRRVMPAEWLFHIPVDLFVYHGELPEPYVRRVLSFGYTLTWDDFLPPYTPKIH